MSLTMATRLGPYEVVGVVGRGGMGEVFRARDTRLSRDVAIKVLPSAFSSDVERLRRLEQEARTAGQLNHPNIVTVYDVGTHEGSPYIVEEFLDGETLAERLAAGPLPPAKAVQYGVGVASGLSAAHAKGIVHRDIKPANLFLTRDGRIKILDFGLAKLTPQAELGSDEATTLTLDPSPATNPGVVLGTVGYMSPEQVRGRLADARSDIFALGTVLYEMVSGRRAFSGSTAPEVLTAILNTDPPELSQLGRPVPGGLEAVIRHCLEKNPTERFQSAQDLGFQLASIGALSGSTPAGASNRPRHRLMGAVAVGLLCLCLGAAVGFLGGRRPKVAPTPPPTFRPLTFQQGWVNDARFGPDGHMVLLSASWADPATKLLYQGDTERSGWIPLALPPYDRIAVSPKGELLLNTSFRKVGRDGVSLARAPMAGGAPRVLRRGLVDGVYAADWSPDGESIAAIKVRPQTVFGGRGGGPGRLEWPLGKLIAERERGWYDDLIRVSHDGQHVALFELSDDGKERSLVLYSQSGTRTAVASGWTETTGLAWAPDDRTLWVSSGWRDQPSGIFSMSLDGSVRSVIRIPGDLRLLDMGPNGRALVSREDTRIELKASAAGAAREVRLSWSDSACPVGLSADGRQMLFRDQSGDWIAPMDGSLPVNLGNRFAEALSPDAQSALAFSDDGGLVIIPTAAGQERHVTSPGLKFEALATWLGNERVVVNSLDGPSFIVNLKDGVARELAAPRPCVQPIGSPDGKWVACENTAFPVDGGASRNIGLGPQALAWDADERHVYKRGSRFGEWPLTIDRVEVGTGLASRWKTIERPDALAGPWQELVVAQDGAAYAYCFAKEESRLYLVEGLE